jgi:hypothetical protein
MNCNNEITSASAASSACEPHYGRRVEADRSWTVHHVFTGIPANIDGVTMSSLDRSDATDIMLSLNRRSVLKTRARDALLRSSATIRRRGG